MIEYYEVRWLVEEIHKAFETGTMVKQRQLKETQRPERMVELLLVGAVRLPEHYGEGL